MSDRTPRPSGAGGALLLAVAALALAGELFDLAAHGAGLGVRDTWRTQILALALALPLAAAAWAVLPLARRLLGAPAEAAARILVAAAAAALALGGLGLRLLPPEGAFGLAGGTGLALALGAGRPNRAGSSRLACQAAGAAAGALIGPAGLVAFDAPAARVAVAFSCVGLGWLAGPPLLRFAAGRWLVGIAFSAALALALLPDPQPQLRAVASDSAQRPNLVLIVLDTQRADFLGPYGGPAGLTPAFDRFAAEGTLYERCFAPAGWTVPSHATLFTGLSPLAHGASFEHHRWLDDRFVTLAERLRDAGYRTVALVANDYLELANLLQGFELRVPLAASQRRLAIRRPLQILGAPARWADHGAADALRRARAQLAAQQGSKRPLFLFVNLLEAHWRYLPPWRERLEYSPPALDPLRATLASLRFYGPLAMAAGTVPPRQAAAVQALYAGAVHYQDRQLGRLLALLDRALDPQRTLVAITADHGENLGGAGRWDHVFALNDALIHVPLAIRYPPRFPAGKRVAGLCEFQDLAATLTDVAGVPRLPGAREGRSLVPGQFRPRRWVHAAGDPYLDHLAAMARRTGLARDVARWSAVLRAVRGERFKLIWSSRDGARLYDLEHDPNETTDVSPRHPEVAASLERELERWIASQPFYREHAREHRGAEGLEPGARERLRSLGYLR